MYKKYAEKGIDIFNINSRFYTDFCTPASVGDNDITLEDRKKDIYPKNVTLCKSNCKYSGIDIEHERVICSCNLNPNKQVEEEELEESENNFVTYLLDYINYRVFLCYKLFFNFNNLKKSYPFYIILGIYLLLQIINYIYLFYKLERLKIELTKELTSNQHIMHEQMSNLKKKNSDIKLANPNKIKTNLKSSKRRVSNFLAKSLRSNSRSNSERKTFVLMLNNKNIINNHNPGEKRLTIKDNKKNINKIFENNEKKSYSIFKRKEIIKIEEKKEKKEENEDLNELPYSKAIREDKRNIFSTYFSFVVDKLELINIYFSDSRLKIILFEEFIVSLVINFFFNALLYTDNVVSNKYHNNGELDFIVTLLLSIVSNIVTSIFCYYTNYTRGIDERIKLIVDIRYDLHYFKNLKKLMLFLKIKFIFFFIGQLLSFATCIYYVVIFCILYSKSQGSLVINFAYSLLESLITAFALSFLIVITRKIGLSCLNKYFYNASKYLNKL